MRAPAIDARAAARPELGGVERWARELSARLPYTVHRPPGALTHRAGHAWEQAVLPLLSARAPALLCPANLAPVAARIVVVVIHDAAPLRHPGWYSGLYAAFQHRVLPLIARRARPAPPPRSAPAPPAASSRSVSSRAASCASSSAWRRRSSTAGSTRASRPD